MKHAFLLLTLLAACLGLGPGLGGTAFSQEPGKKGDTDKGNARPALTWEQLARQAGLVGMLQARPEERFRVDAQFARRNTQAWCVKAEIELTAAEWAHLSQGGSGMDFLSSWCHGDLGDGDFSMSTFISARTVDTSKIPARCRYIALGNPAGEETRLYVLAPGKDGESGSLFYFYRMEKPLPPAVEDGGQERLAR